MGVGAFVMSVLGLGLRLQVEMLLPHPGKVGSCGEKAGCRTELQCWIFPAMCGKFPSHVQRISVPQKQNYNSGNYPSADF